MSYLPVVGLKSTEYPGELAVAKGVVKYINLSSTEEASKLSTDLSNGAVAACGPVSENAEYTGSGTQTEVVINTEIEPSKTANAIVSLVGEVELKTAPVVKVEVGSVKGGSLHIASETSNENSAAAAKLIDITTIVVPAGGVYKVPTVANLKKLFASVALQG